MEQRNLSALLLAMAVLLMWGQWRAAHAVKTDAEIAGVEAPVMGDGTAGTEPVTPIAPAPPSAAVPFDQDFPERRIAMDGCSAKLQWDTRTGSASALQLPKYEAPQRVNELWRYVTSGELFSNGLGGWHPYGADAGPQTLAGEHAQLFAMGSGALSSASPATVVSEEGAGRLMLTGRTADGIEVQRRVVVSETDPCVFDVQLAWTNRSDKPFSGGLWAGLHEEMGGSAGYYSNLVRPYAMTGGKVQEQSDLTKLATPVALDAAVQWFGIADRYFVAALLPQHDSTGRVRFSERTGSSGDMLYGEHFVVPDTLAPGATHTETLRLYVGPMDYDLMAKVDVDLAYLVKWHYGWFAFFCFPLLWLLRQFHWLFGNWGVAIIALTMFVKGVTFPLTQSSFRSGQAMQAVQPQIAELKERFKDEPEKLNQEMLRIFQENGVNPVGGCLPMLVQMPVWFALYRVLLSSVDLYHTDFLFIKDLSVADPYLVIPTLAMITTVAQQRMMPMPANMDPTQARMLKAMPLVFGFFFFAFPAGLVLYIFVNMILTTAQQWLIRRQFESAAVPAPAGTTH